ncbi:cupin domain-containing protein [Pinirhizobacter sp.]|jgi:quercetin dioxygenase-like cupin family protein|uniref:cupin domain-containing protein n=1 Tax=Pinirhizobacter sp. TaxID=2950432 RepID=UPI002F3E4048
MSKIEKVIFAAAASLLVVAGNLIPDAAQAQQTGTHRTDLSRNDISIPGWEAVQVRVDIDPGKIAPNHRHPGEEIIYVVEGTILYQLEGKPPATLKAGDVLFVPKGVIHSAKNVGQTNAAEIGTYIVPKGKPLVEWIR